MKQETLCDPPVPEGGCVNHESCENMTPGGAESQNKMCDSCLDAVRHGDAQ